MIIKENFEDFLVDEIPVEDMLQEEGNYHVYLLKKTNYTTERAVNHIAKALRLPRKAIGYAGTKDKQAITTQYITIKGRSKEKVLGLELKDLELSFIGYRKESLALGELLGNTFRILVKEVSFQEGVPVSFYVPNYFDEQRFSTHNVAMGKCILSKQYKEATDIIIHEDKDFAQEFTEHLAKSPQDYIGALRKLPKRTLLFYMHSIQSYVFNERLAQHIQNTYDSTDVSYSEGSFSFPTELLHNVDQFDLNLIGYDSQEGYEDINPRDFLNKSLPEISLEGSSRPAFSFVDKVSLEEREEGVYATFTLGKGSTQLLCSNNSFLKQFLATA